MLFNKYDYGYHVKEDEMGGACNRYGGEQKCAYSFGWKTQKGRDHLKGMSRLEDNIKTELE